LPAAASVAACGSSWQLQMTDAQQVRGITIYTADTTTDSSSSSSSSSSSKVLTPRLGQQTIGIHPAHKRSPRQRPLLLRFCTPRVHVPQTAA
jgi:hypothetical protein